MKRTLRRLALLCLSSVLALGVAEAGFRALLVARFERAGAAFDHDFCAIDPGTEHLYTMQPDTHRVNRVSEEPDAWEWTFTTDSAGRRVVIEDDAAVPRAEGGPRVVALGDSYTFGWGVDDEHTYPAQLERLLRDHDGLAEVNVINAGTPGFNTMQEASYLTSRWDELRPDVVVLGFVMNDAEPPRIAHRDPRERYSEASVWLLEELLLRTGRGDGWLTSKAQRRRAFPLQFAEGSPENALCRRSLGKIADQCAEHSVPLLVFIMPGMMVLPKTPDGTYPYHGIHGLVEGWGKELGLLTVNLWARFEGADRNAMQVPGDGHPSELALGIFAEAMAPHVAAALRD